YAAAGSVLCNTAKKSGSRVISMNRRRFPVRSGCDDGTARGDETARNVQALAGVAESRQDVAAFIQFAIECGAQYRNVGMRVAHARDAKWRRDQAKKTDANCARLLEQIGRAHVCTPAT